MAVSKVFSAHLSGIDCIVVEIEVDIQKGLPSTNIVGLPDVTVKESKERVYSAITHSGYEYPRKKIVINLAPANLKKRGSVLDLGIAISILIAGGQCSPKEQGKYIFLGEFSLSGELRKINGVLPIVKMARHLGYQHVVLPKENADEASLISDMTLYAICNLADCVKIVNEEPDAVSGILTEGVARVLTRLNSSSCRNAVQEGVPELSDVKGNYHAKRAIEIACSGFHSILLLGPPGCGKSMLSKRIPWILPGMTERECLETTAIYSAAGLLPEETSVLTKRPFRSPHHTITDVAMIGGGSIPKPGEISLSHNGVLFLDEFPEFKRNVLQSLREPMENHVVMVSRADYTVQFPCRFMLVATMNPCPCGYWDRNVERCQCSEKQRHIYYRKISGPLLDRIDLQIELSKLPYEDWDSSRPEGSSFDAKARISKCRFVQEDRFKNNVNCSFNSEMESEQLKRYCVLNDSSRKIMETIYRKENISARGLNKIVKISRTIADMDGSKNISEQHVLEAFQYRALERLMPKIDIYK